MKDDRLMSKIIKWRVKLIFQGTYRLFGTEIVECLKSIDVGCRPHPKQFDVEADRKCILYVSFSAVNENADENEIPFSAEKRKRKSPVPISRAVAKGRRGGAKAAANTECPLAGSGSVGLTHSDPCSWASKKQFVDLGF